MKINKIKLILLIIFLVSCGSGSSDKSPEPFNFVIEAVNEAYDYSLIEIKANSPSSILSLQLISDDLTLISSNNSTLSVLLPIVFSDTLFEYQVKAINSSGISTTVSKTILVKVYPHGIENYSLLGQTDTENFLTNDYAVFNFSFEAINTDEPFTETLCYPTVNDCSEEDGIFTSDMHNSNYGDFNGDGYEDLVVTWAVFPHTLERESTKSQVEIYLNDGTGRLKKDHQFFFDREPPSRHMTYRIVVEDFNLDGIDDIFVGSMGLSKRNPDGSYTSFSEPNVLLLSDNGLMKDASNMIDYKGETSFSHDASAGDVNGDGYPDILAGRALFLSNLGQSFTNISEQLPADWRDWSKYQYAMSSLMEDFNGDGLADIVMLWNDDEFNPNPPKPEIALSNSLLEIKDWEIRVLPEGFFGSGLTKFNYAKAADIDSDEDLDIVIGTTRANPYYIGRYIQILINDGEGNFSDESLTRLPNQDRSVNFEDPDETYECKTYGEGPLFIRDFEGDGDLDIFDQTASNSPTQCPGITIFLNDGEGKFQKDVITQIAWVSGIQIAGFEYEGEINPINRSIPLNLDQRNKLDFAAEVYAPSYDNIVFLYEVISTAD